jgi:heme oxygenase-like protein
MGLDAAYGAYLDVIPGVTLATVNLMSLMGLHRRWRGGIAGHLALFEMTSSLPNGRYGRGLRRLGLEAATAFFDEHVEADAVHENIAAVHLAGGLARAEPQLTGQILWGARALAELEARWARQLLGCWERGVISLRAAAPSRAPA